VFQKGPQPTQKDVVNFRFSYEVCAMASESSLSPLIGTQVDGGHSDGLVAARDLKYHQQPPAYEGHQPTVKLPRRQQQLLIFKNISFIGAIIACIAAALLLPSELRTGRTINEGSFFLHATKKGPVNQKCFTSGFFAITLQFGDFSFDTAKLIDITWDLVVGRGGQLCLAYISYPIRWQIVHFLPSRLDRLTF
jgi:hypothetical protein